MLLFSLRNSIIIGLIVATMGTIIGVILRPDLGLPRREAPIAS